MANRVPKLGRSRVVQPRQEYGKHVAKMQQGSGKPQESARRAIYGDWQESQTEPRPRGSGTPGSLCGIFEAAGSATLPQPAAETGRGMASASMRLWDAAQDGKRSEVARLIKFPETDVNWRNPDRNWLTITCGQDGLTALMAAAYGGHLEVVRTLLAAGAQVDAKASPVKAGMDGATALVLAAQQGHSDVADLLLSELEWLAHPH